MVITKTLPSEAANVLEKGVRKVTPRIMTWGQYGEAALNYIQQVSTARHASAHSMTEHGTAQRGKRI